MSLIQIKVHQQSNYPGNRPTTTNRTNLEPTLDKQRRIVNWIISIDRNLEPTNITNMTPLENIKLIEDTFALVKQQRLDRPPKPTPNQDHPLESSEEQLDRIVARFQLEQENELEHQIFLNRFLREFQAHKKLIKMEEVKESYRIVEKAIAALLAEIRSNPNHVNFLNFRPDAYQRKAEWLLSELKKNRANGAKEESQYLAFVQLYGDYKEELVKARKLVNTPAPEIDPGTVTPKKLEKVPAKNTCSSAKKAKPTVCPTLESTGNVLLDAHIAKKAANELKNIVPLDISDTSTVESTDSSFTTKPFELNDLFPENLKEKLSIALKKTPKGTSTPIPAKITTKTTPKAKLPVIEDSEDELMDNGKPSQSRNPSANKTNVSTRSNRPELHPRLDNPEPRVRKGGRPSNQLTPIVNLPKEGSRGSSPSICGDYPEPQSDEEEAPDKELIKTLVKKHVKIYRTYLTTTSKKDKKDLLDRAQESQKILHKLIGNQAVQAYVKGWNPWDEKKKEFPAPPKNRSKKRPRTQSSSGPSNLPFKRHQGLNADLKDPEKWKRLGRVTTILEHMLHHMYTVESNHAIHVNSLLNNLEKLSEESNNVLLDSIQEISKTIVGPTPVEMGPMEKKFVHYLNSEIKRLIALAEKLSVATNPETLLELYTQIKYLRDITFKTEKSQTKLCEIFEKSNLEFFPRLMQENNVALANTQREISNLSASLNLPVEKNNVPSTEHLNSLQDNITSSIRQDLITEVRVHNQKDNRNLTTMIEDKFNKLFERLDTIENKLQADLPVLNHDIDIIKRDITYLRENTPHQIASPPITKKSASPAEHFTKHESNRATPPHMTPYIEDRGPRRSEKEVSKLLPPLTEWVSFSGTGEYDYVEFIQFCDLILETYWAKDEIITIRLPRLFKDVANKWWKTKSTAIGQVDWQTWKDLIKAQFGTDTWQAKIRKAFTASRLDPAQHVVATWCLDQKRRLDCFSPDLTQAEANRRILEQCRGDLSHGIKCRTSLDIDLTVLISTMEEVIEDIGLNKKYSKDFSNKPKNETSTTPPTANKPETGAPRRTVASGACFNCGDKNHRKHECPNPQKKVMAIEGNPAEEEEEPQDSDEEPHSDLEVMNTTPEDHYRYEVIHADIGDEISINAIQGDSNLPQSWEPSMELGHVSDAKLLTNKPETGRCYTLGKTSYTTVIFQNSPTKAVSLCL
ncbi:hypothetical protein Pst134EA_029253 [Puccinia striiformis f. sp. tritici]|uniref:hypothetical protein n=1 Tax=Puccinia striiformis f. sp. tritici TaxID=168172 RepID=UPI002008E23F|nr:hypothetical protein Pst134EA_029253 [Puccinia striiformis f. sp. tritici]KAH9447218.1 hypothetical protein Pst134EA_029253 [Puccinia striiformis f. sp. tritici]